MCKGCLDKRAEMGRGYFIALQSIGVWDAKHNSGFEKISAEHLHFWSRQCPNRINRVALVVQGSKGRTNRARQLCVTVMLSRIS